MIKIHASIDDDILFLRLGSKKNEALLRSFLMTNSKFNTNAPF